MRPFSIRYVALALLAANALYAQIPSVVINEIMYDDTVASPNMQWLELHNTTAASVNIGNWIITDAAQYPPTTEGAWRIPAGTSIPANGYLVCAAGGLLEIEGEVDCDSIFGSIVFGTSGDNISLYTALSGGTLIDGSLSTSFPDLAASNAGNSIEKCNENSGWSGISANWHQSLNQFATTGRYRYCTPGFANTACPDLTAPAIDSAVAISPTQVNVYFNESVEQISAETESNYAVDGGVGAPTAALRDGTVLSLVHLTFNPIPNGNYFLTVNGVQDLAGNPAVNRTDFFSVNFSGGPSGIVITEIMYDDTGATDVEWVEIHNRTAAAVDVSGWVLIDASNYPPGATEGGWLVPAATSVPAGAYRVLANVDLAGITGEILCTHYDSTFDLNNAGDNLALYSAQTAGTLMDGSLSVSFPDLAPTELGYSIEKCAADSGWSGNPASWHISGNSLGTGRYRRGTPGVANSVCTGDVTLPTFDSVTVINNQTIDAHFSEPVELYTSQTLTNYSVSQTIGNPATATRQANNRTVRLTFAVQMSPSTYALTVNNVEDIAANRVTGNSSQLFSIETPPSIKFSELMPDPNFAGAADSSGEWFEVYNAGGTTVSLTGWIIADGAGSDTIEGAVSINPSQYFVFAARGDSAGNGGIPDQYDYKFGASGWGLSLDNTGETLALRNSQNTTVAQLNYTGFPFVTGRSCQLKNVTYNPTIDTSWCQAYTVWSGAWNGDRGTPGAAAVCPDAIPPSLTSVTVLSNIALDLLFNESVGAASAAVLTNYVVSGGIGTPLSASRDGANLALVHLGFNPIPPNSYFMTVNGVQDLTGNACVDEQRAFNVVPSGESVLNIVRTSNLSTAVTEWNAGTVECPDSMRQWFFFKNFGGAPLAVNPPFTVAGPHFLVTSTCLSTINLTPLGVSGCSLAVTFAQPLIGAYVDTLRIPTNASNAVGGIVSIPLAGTRASTPASPIVTVRRSGNDAVLNWFRVTETAGGCPATIEQYQVLSTTSFDSGFTLLTTTTDSTYSHVNIISTGGLTTFYQVIAIDN
ncbi:lamin tail domain-containing protein [candidate division KSB1 bacterium]|nr:lamin tail domain-containing protein [candidate division KSB1 bacterium]